MTIARLRASWNGPGVVGASISTFYFNDVSADTAAVLAFFDAVKGLLPDDVSIVVPNTGDLIDEASGSITGTWTQAGGGTVTGTSLSVFAIGVGVRVVWETAGIRNGRHVRGSTFLVPTTSGAFDATGRILNTATTTLQNAANAFLAATGPTPTIWSRPLGAQNGAVNNITSAVIPDNPTTLRSRRT